MNHLNTQAGRSHASNSWPTGWFWDDDGAVDFEVYA